MSKIEAIRRTLLEIGDAAPEQLAAHMQSSYGVRIDPRYIPVLKATLRDKDLLCRRAADSQSRHAA